MRFKMLLSLIITVFSSAVAFAQGGSGPGTGGGGPGLPGGELCCELTLEAGMGFTQSTIPVYGRLPEGAEIWLEWGPTASGPWIPLPGSFEIVGEGCDEQFEFVWTNAVNPHPCTMFLWRYFDTGYYRASAGGSCVSNIGYFAVDCVDTYCCDQCMINLHCGGFCQTAGIDPSHPWCQP